MNKEKKAFKDTIFGKILNKAKGAAVDIPSIALQAATGDIKGALNTAKIALLGSVENKEVLSELKLRELEIINELARTELVEVTKRWEADMKSDSWLSKNIRPITLGILSVLFITIIICGLCKVLLPDIYFTQFMTTYTVVISAYFGLRGVDKYIGKRYK